MYPKLYKAGTPIPESWYTLTFEEGCSCPDMVFQFIKDAHVLEIGGKRYAQAVEPVKNQGKARDKFDVVGITGTGLESAKLDFPCVMLRYEHDMMAIVGKGLFDKPNKLSLAIRKSIRGSK